MVGRALGGRDPVRELVLLPPRLLVPPPLQVSCREESWPGMEMDLAVDGGLERTERCDRGAPAREPAEGTGAPSPPAACTRTHVLKHGSPESRNIPMVTCGAKQSQPSRVHPLDLGARPPRWGFRQGSESDPTAAPRWPWRSCQTSLGPFPQATGLTLTPASRDWTVERRQREMRLRLA